MLYIDVDAVCKLAHWNMLQQLPQLSGYDWPEVATLSSLRYRAQRSIKHPDRKLFFSSGAAEIAVNSILKMAELPGPNIEKVAYFGDISMIDAGEAVLLALTADDPNGMFLTGDKKAIKALSLLACTSWFYGRIIIIEQILNSCLDFAGDEWLRDNVCPYKDIDTTVAIIMGSRCDRDLKSIKDGINSYVGYVANFSTPSLLKDPLF